MTDFGLGDCNEADMLAALRWHVLIDRPEPNPDAVPFKPLARSWSGSERERREQMPCSPPSVATRFTPRFRIPAGTAVQVCEVVDSGKHWMNYTTKREIGFERYEYAECGEYVFRESGYFVRVRFNRVIQRKRT